MLKFNELSHKLFGTTEGDGDIQPKEGWAFSIAGFGQNLVCTIIGSYLMAFMTEGMGFDSEMMLFGTGKWQTGAMAVAWLMLFTRIFDACNDPIMGSIVDRTRTKWGKCRPYLKWMPVPIAFMTAMCFLPFFPTTKTGFWIVAVVYVTWSVAYTIVDVPYWGLSTAMTNDTTKRGNMLTIARLCCTAGAGLVTIFIPVLTGNIPKWRGLMVESVKLDAANNIVFDKNGAVVKEWVIKSGMQLQYQNCLKWIYFLSAVIIVLCAIPMFYYGFKNTKERYTTDKEPPTLGHNLKLLFKNDQLLLIVLSGILGSAKMVYMGVGGLYFMKYVMHAESSYGLVTMLVVPGGLIASVLVPWCTKKLGKKNTYIYSHLLGAVFMFLMYFVRWESTGALVVAVISLIIVGIPSGIGNIVTYAMIGDTVEYLEWKTGERAEGICFAMQTFINKIGMAAGAFIGLIGYNAAGLSTKTISTTAEQSTALWNYIVLPGAISMFLTVIPMLFYNFTEKRQAEVVAEIAARHAAESSEAGATDSAPAET